MQKKHSTNKALFDKQEVERKALTAEFKLGELKAADGEGSYIYISKSYLE